MCLSRVNKKVKFRKSKHDLLKVYKVVQAFRDTLWLAPFRLSEFQEGVNEVSLDPDIDLIGIGNESYFAGFHLLYFMV